MNINELYAIVRNGEKSAEKKLFDKLSERFQLILQQKIRNITDAEDILQSTLIIIARKYLDIAFEKSFSSWAYKVLENNILNYYRTKGRYRNKFEELTEQTGSAVIMPDAELKQRLLNCLKKINEMNIKHARILNFSYQGYDMEQICQKLKLTRNGAYILLSRARAKLKTCMKMDR